MVNWRWTQLSLRHGPPQHHVVHSTSSLLCWRRGVELVSLSYRQLQCSTRISSWACGIRGQWRIQDFLVGDVLFLPLRFPLVPPPTSLPFPLAPFLAGTTTWNFLPETIRAIADIRAFKRVLKTNFLIWLLNRCSDAVMPRLSTSLSTRH